MLDTETEGCYSSPALVGQTLFVGSDGLKNNHLFALDPADGSVRWKDISDMRVYRGSQLWDDSGCFGMW